jgi:uncharacterized protein (DUF58 family)
MAATSPSQNFLDPAVLAGIQNYPLMARTAVEGFLSGQHRSLYHGHGSEFFQYRAYTAGDDLKYVDWKVMARHNSLHTKLFEEETNMDVCFVMDGSASMMYQGEKSPCSKWHYACIAAACLAWLARGQGDAFGLYIYDDELRAVLPPGRRTGHFQSFVNELAAFKPRKGRAANHEATLDFLARRMRRRGLIVFISDMLEAEESLPPLLRRLDRGGRDCLALQVLDNDELDLPMTGAWQLRSLEGRAEILTDPGEIRDTYVREMNEFLETLKKALSNAEVDHLLCRTRDHLGRVLAAYLHRRELFS